MEHDETIQDFLDRMRLYLKSANKIPVSRVTLDADDLHRDGYFLPTYEVIYLIAKKGFRLAPKGNRHGDVWDIAQERNNPHPAPFPVDLAERIIASTNASIVLDPFMGSGTTAVAAQKLQRNFIGIDISPEYCEMARIRVAESMISV